MDVTLFRLSIAFTLVTGTGAGVLAALSWEVLRESPLGTTLGLLAVVMSIATLYHGGLLVAGSETPVLESLLVLGYVLVAVSLAAAISELNNNGWHTTAWSHRYVLPAAIGGLLLYAVGGPLSEVFYPSMLHWVHGFAALSAIAGLYSPVHNDLQDGSGNGRDPVDVVERLERGKYRLADRGRLHLVGDVESSN